MRMEEDIVGSGWKVGALIGSEAELVLRYGVSRWVMREAIRILEQDGLVEIRRGRFGGIAVSAPVLNVVGSSIRRFLSVSRVPYDALYEARSVLEIFAVTLAAQRLDPDRIRALQALLDRAADAPEDQHLQINFLILLEILRTAGNSALEAFTYSLSQATTDLALIRGISEVEWKHVANRLIKLRTQLVKAILAGNMSDAEDLVKQGLRLSLDSLLELAQGQKSPTPISAQQSLGFGMQSKVVRPKLADQITRQIEYDLSTNNWAPGTILGSEAELMQRYSVSRSVIREAIRPLERLGAVEMCRGKNSGLKVATPEPSAIVHSVVLYLKYSKNDGFASYELRKEIELVVVARLAQTTDALRQPVAQRLREFAQLSFSPSLASLRQVNHHLGLLLAESAENAIFSFFLRILAETVLLSSRCTLSASDAAAVIRAVQTMAITLGDAIEMGSAAKSRACIESIWDTLRQAYDLPKKKLQQKNLAA